MANKLNDITFVRANGGLGRPLAGEDHISGLLFYQASLPIGFGTDNIKQILDLPDAEDKGITADSAFRVLHYHISEFFRICDGATLFVGIYPENATFDEVVALQRFAEGKIRQTGVYTQTALATPMIAALQERATELENEYRYVDILLSPDISSIADLVTLPDLRFQDKPDVSVCIAQAGDATGAELFESEGKSVGCIGALLGSVAYAKVNECIGWVEKFNIAGTQLDVPAFGNGQLVKDKESALPTLNDKGYIFLRKLTGIAGSYWNDSHTCAAITSDYAYIEANRTMKKAMRGIRTYLLPYLNSNVNINPDDGTIDAISIAVLENAAEKALEQMEKNGELSGYRAYINPDQNILATSELEIAIKNVPTGVIRKMKVKIGYAASL